MDSASKIFKQICPDEIESADKLKRNMYKFTSTRDLEFRQYDKLPNTDPIKRVGMEIEQMFEDF